MGYENLIKAVDNMPVVESKDVVESRDSVADGVYSSIGDILVDMGKQMQGQEKPGQIGPAMQRLEDEILDAARIGLTAEALALAQHLYRPLEEAYRTVLLIAPAKAATHPALATAPTNNSEIYMRLLSSQYKSFVIER